MRTTWQTHSSNAPEAVLVFDLGSGSIAGSLVILAPGKKPRILYSTRVDFPAGRERFSAALLHSLQRSVEQASEEISRHGMPLLSKEGLSKKSVGCIYCVYSSLWHIARIESIEEAHAKPFVIHEKNIKEAIKKCEQAMATSFEEKEKLDRQSFLKLDHRIISFKINGYESAAPFGTTARSLSMTLFLSIIPEAVVAAVERTITKSFHPHVFNHHSMTLASFSALSLVSKEKEDSFMLVDAEGELTDILIVKEGTIAESGSFPIGHEYLIRTLSKDLGRPEEEVVSRALLEKQGRNNATFSRQLSHSSARIGETWKERFTKTLMQFEHTTFLPRTTYLLSPSATMPFFLPFLTSANVGYEKSLSNFSKIVPLSPRTFDEYLEVGKGVRRDPFIELEAIFVHTMHE